ncbi:IL17RD [Branchiostoma lanceolatum]|uniref:IL17RD protein n=1 Tax=Branchiostoma lanceolatum TaxID=7740 RepID=A0A8K0EVM1_BRALA|nr:IL17RD [Branchiostoma lanceolatum]
MAARYFVLTLLTTVLAVAVLTAEASTACNRRCSKQVDILSCLRRCKRGTVQHRARHGRTGPSPVAFNYPLQEVPECPLVPIKDASITSVPHLEVSDPDASIEEKDRVIIKWRPPATGYERVTGFEIKITSTAGVEECKGKAKSDSCRQLVLNRTLQAEDVLSTNYFEYITDLPRGQTYRVQARPLPGQDTDVSTVTTVEYEARECEAWEARRNRWKPYPVEIVQIVGRNVTVRIPLAPGDLKIYDYKLHLMCRPEKQQEDISCTVKPYNGTEATCNKTLIHIPPGSCDIKVSPHLPDPIESSSTSFNVTDWTPDNLTAYYDGEEVSATFRAAPPEYNFPEYRMCLTNASASDRGASKTITCDPLFNKDDDTGVATAVFKDVKPLPIGHLYAVKVAAPYEDSQWTQVPAVLVTLPRSKATTRTGPNTKMHPTHIAVVVTVAVVIGLALLGTLYYLRKKKLHLLASWPPIAPGTDPVYPERRSIVFLVYSYDCPEHFLAVERYATFLQRMGFDVVFDMWCTNQISCVGKVDWACEQLDKADYVIIICSRGARHKMEDQNKPPLQEGLLGDMFTPWVKEIGSRIHSGDSDSLGKYVVAYFSYSSAEDVPRTLRTVQPYYKLLKHMPELFCHLQGLERRSPAGTARVTGLEDIQRETMEGQQLVEAIDTMQKICDGKPDWLFKTDDGSAPDVADVSTPYSLQEEMPLLPTPSENSVDMEEAIASIGDAQGDETAQAQQPLLNNRLASSVEGRLSTQEDDYRVDVSPSEDVSTVADNVEPVAPPSGTQKGREYDPDSGISATSEPNVDEPRSTLVQAPPPSQAFAPQVPASQEQYHEYGATAPDGTFANDPREMDHFNHYTHPTMNPNYVGGHIYENPKYVRSPSFDPYNYYGGQDTGHQGQPGGYPYRKEGHGSDEQLDSGIFMEIEEQMRRHNEKVMASMSS